MNANVVALSVLLIASPLGAFDSFYYHTLKFRLYERPESRFEEVTHLVRSVVIGVVALVLSRGELHGNWYWFASALFLFDFVNNVLDTISEESSRKSLGGLPLLEQVIHIIGATMTGGAAAAFIVLGWPLAHLETEIAAATQMPSWLASLATGLGGAVIVSATIEAGLFVRAWRRSVVQNAVA